MKKIYNSNTLFITLCVLSTIAALYFTSQFSFKWMTDPDAANSPMIWREFKDIGFKAFSHWTPTFDNWYFTVYPVNFLLFIIFNDDGITPIVISTAIFITAVCLCSALIARMLSNNLFASIFLTSVTLLSPDIYISGYYSHPFSHNSTNAFGFIIFLIYLSSINSKKIAPLFFISLLSILASASDPWVLVSFTLPILISELFNFYKNRERLHYLSIITISFIISITNLVQRLFNLPVHGFSLTSIDQMLSNANQAVSITAKILPLWYGSGKTESYLMFLAWVVVLAISAALLIRKGGRHRITALVCSLSIMGVYSSSIIGDQEPHQRFYLNVIPCLMLIISLASQFNRYLIIPLLMTMIISITLLFGVNFGYKKNQNPVDDYVKFLNVNKLDYGYGSFWGMNMSVNWLSKGAIHITPVYFSKSDGSVDFKSVRVQTLSTWHKKEFINSQPPRQFIAISKGMSGDRCMDIELCVAGVQKQIGKADEILKYNDMTFLIYANPIQTGID